MRGEFDEETSALITAFHFDKEVAKTHGVPFVVMIKKDEPFKETKERISKRTGIKGKALERVKIALIPRSSYGKAEYLEDGKLGPTIAVEELI